MNTLISCMLLSCLVAVVSSDVHCSNSNASTSTSTEQYHGTSNSSEGSARLVEEKVLSRKKRYLTFPTGSTVQLIFCLTIPVLAKLEYAFGYTVSVAYLLPSDTRDFFKDDSSPEMMHRRDRRDLYPKIETFLKSHDMEGRDCVLRALCESGQRRTNSKGEFFEELLHAIFSLPAEGEDAELDGPVHYDQAHRANENCTLLFPGCSQSLFDLVLQ